MADAETHERKPDDEQPEPWAERRITKCSDLLERGQQLHENADENRIRDCAHPDTRAKGGRDCDHDCADDNVRGAERKRRLVRKSLVKNVPRRQPEAGLEQRDDPCSKQKQPRSQ